MKKSVKMIFLTSQEDHDEMKKFCSERGISMSFLIRKAIKNIIAEFKGES